jgi:hypothetical protein
MFVKTEDRLSLWWYVTEFPLRYLLYIPGRDFAARWGSARSFDGAVLGDYRASHQQFVTFCLTAYISYETIQIQQ